MKISATFLFVLIPLVAFAQGHPGMSEKGMEQMMQQMGKMQSCMQNVDQAKLRMLEQRSKQFEAEIKSLCAKGKRDEAQKKAIAYGMEMAKDPSLQEMRKCGEMMQGMMPKMPYMGQDKGSSSHHVCD